MRKAVWGCRGGAAALLLASLTDIGALAGSGVHCDDDPALEDEPQGGGAVVGLHILDNLALKGIDLQAGSGGRRTGVVWSGWAREPNQQQTAPKPARNGAAWHRSPPIIILTSATGGSGKLAACSPAIPAASRPQLSREGPARDSSIERSSDMAAAGCDHFRLVRARTQRNSCW